MKPICTACEQVYRCHKSGINVIEVIGAEQRPYKLWKADLYKCPGCGHEIVTAFGMGPFKTDWDEGFEATVEKVKALTDYGPYYAREIGRGEVIR